MFSRRDFLIRSTGFVTVSAMVPRWAVRGASRFEESVGAAFDGRTLVVLELAGGNDGLNTVVPYADALYPQLRSRIGVPHSSPGCACGLPPDSEMITKPVRTESTCGTTLVPHSSGGVARRLVASAFRRKVSRS